MSQGDSTSLVTPNALQAEADPSSSTDHETAPPKSTDNPHSQRRASATVDRDAQSQVIESLRNQVQDLFSQVTQLNNKLVKSYDRVSDLEDELHVTSQNLRTSSVKISELELERSTHLSALNTGLLVEREQVTAELTRLMEKATDEAARRGQAETARAEIEKDLGDLSAGLFNQANTMVAEARFTRAQSERKAEEAERSLEETEELVRLMQQQMQELQAEKEKAERKANEGTSSSWIAASSSPFLQAQSYLFLRSHVPYHEFTAFISHLRGLRPTSTHPPAVSTLLQLPFLSRLVAEDTDPTVRLDMAPSLNWLTRRTFISAIHLGQLTVEPMATQVLIESPPNSYPSIPGSNPGIIACALCGSSIYSPEHIPSSATSTSTRSQSRSNSWSNLLTKNPLSSTPPSPPSGRHRDSVLPLDLPAQVYICRLSAPTPSSTLPGSQSRVQNTVYPLCTSGWCLTRLRATCSLWAFVRTSVVEKIWEETPMPSPVPPPAYSDVTYSPTQKPPVPPRRRGLWGVASALGIDRVASFGSDDKSKNLDQPPPAHPSRSPEPEKNPRHSVPPPLASPIPKPAPPNFLPKSAPLPTAPSTPPPLPRRSMSRTNTQTPTQHADAHEVVFSADLSPPAKRLSFRPSSPAMVPLPESQPASPAPRLPGSIEPPVDQSPAEPATSSDGPTGSSSDVKIQSTPPPPRVATPPPVPRRAATRRPVPPTPTRAPARSSTLKLENKLDHAAPIVNGHSVHGSEARADVIPPAAEAREPGTPTDVAPAGMKTEDTGVNTQAEAELSEVEPGQAPLGADPEKGPDLHVEAPTPDAKPPLPERPRRALVRNSVDESHRQSIISNGLLDLDHEPELETRLAPDGTEFLGDAKWEERTWKELVRLREDMFWARIGATR